MHRRHTPPASPLALPPVLALTFALIPALVIAPHALASGPITIPWFTLDAGGGVSTEGTLRLRGTMSQWDGARRGALTAGSLRLTGGFWGYGVAPPCPASYNNDGVPGDILDFLDFLDDFGACENLPPPCGSWGDPDLNGDTFVDVLDFLDFLDSFGTGC